MTSHKTHWWSDCVKSILPKKALWLVKLLKNIIANRINNTIYIFRLQTKETYIHFNTEITRSNLGKFCHVGERVIFGDSDLGDHSYVAEGAVVLKSRIGKFCSLGPRCQVGLAQHPSRKFVSTHPDFYLVGDGPDYRYADKNYFNGIVETIIGNDVWVGSNVCVKGGVKIGDGAIVGAGAVVTQDIPAYAIYGGVPAKLIRYRFDPQTIQYLLTFKWWDRDEAWLRQHYQAFHDIDVFMKLIMQRE
jgi:acetyltransferase-like isoleucine patch superfamily enzyme